MTEVFLDTSHVIALASAADQHHATARRWQRYVEQHNTRGVTTQAVLLEVGNTLAKLRFRQTAAAIIAGLTHDPTVDVVPLTPDLFDRGFALFRDRPDKEWGLVDCVSFTVMREWDLQAALTADAHFQQAGFRALLLERSA